MTYNSSQTSATSFLDSLVEIFPPLEGDEFAAFVADVGEHGLRETITRYHDKVIDGRNRERACAAAGVTPRYENFEGTEAEAVAFVISKNVLRRHLTQEQKRDLIAKLLQFDTNKSDRQIAKTVGVHNETVATVRKQLVAKGDVTDSVTRADSKGRKQPARKTTRPASYSAPHRRSAGPAAAVAGLQLADMWHRASSTERMRFLDQIGAQHLRAHIPASWGQTLGPSYAMPTDAEDDAEVPAPPPRMH